MCSHSLFTFFITIIILANTAVLALEKYPEDPNQTKVKEILNELFTWIFVAEMVIKMIGLGFKQYVRDSYNIFDVIVVILSIVEEIYSSATSSNN